MPTNNATFYDTCFGAANIAAAAGCVAGPAASGCFFFLEGASYAETSFRQRLSEHTTFKPGRIRYDCTPEGTTFVTGIRLSGFHKGAVLLSGHPASPDSRQVTAKGPEQVFDLTPEEFQAGVYVMPPEGSALAMDVTMLADVVELGSGMTDTLVGGFTVEGAPAMEEHLGLVAQSGCSDEAAGQGEGSFPEAGGDG